MNKNDTTSIKKNEIHLYLDGELSENAKADFELRLIKDTQLRKELESVRKLKAFINETHEPLSEDPFFTTRLMAALNERKHEGFSKYKWFGSGSLLVILTGVILFFFWLNPVFIDKQIDAHKQNIMAFYSENLRPLFEDRNLTTAQVFDFAFNNSIVLDNNAQQELHIDAHDGNSSIIEVRLRDGSTESINFEEFLDKLELSEEGKEEMDSILNYYAPKIASAILVNDNNAIAINSNLIGLQQAVRAEIYNVAMKHNSRGLKVLVPDVPLVRDRENINKFVSQVKNTKTSDFLLFSPDTIFAMQLFLDTDSLRKEIEKNWQEFEREPGKEKRKRKAFSFSFKGLGNGLHGRMGGEEMRIFADSLSLRVEIPGFPLEITIPEMDSIHSQIDRSIVHLRRIPLPDSLYGKKRMRTYFDFRSSESDSSFTFDFSIPQMGNIDSLLNNFGVKRGILSDSMFVFKKGNIDSSAVFFNFPIDSLKSGIYFDNDELREEMQEFQNEIRRFREEMMEMRRDLQKVPAIPDSMKIKRKKSQSRIEI